MRYLTTGLALLAFPAFATVNDCSYTWSGGVRQSSGSVTNQTIVTQSTVVSFSIPNGANQFVYTGDGAQVCENSIRCGTSFPGNVSETGWIKVAQGDKVTLRGNNSVSQSFISVRSGAVSSTFHAFEWCKY